MASEATDQWRREIVETFAEKIVLVEVSTDRARGLMRIPDSIERASVVRQYLGDESFRSQLAEAHALTLNWQGPDGAVHFILLNMALAGQWKNGEDGLIAHELGHTWLHALGFIAPPFQPGPRACIAIHAGDIVQHVLIREEMKRRGISGLAYMIGNLKLSLKHLESGQRLPLTPCQRLTLLSQWMDVRLGLSLEDWDQLARYQELHRARYPELEPYAADLEQYIRAADLADRMRFIRAVIYTGHRLEELFDSTTDPPRSGESGVPQSPP